MKSSFDTWVHASNDNVATSIKTFEKKINALHGSSYGHLTKTTLPNFAQRIGVLEARAQLTPPLPTETVDPSANEDVDAKEAAAVADDVDNTNNRHRVEVDANPRRRSDATANVDDNLDTNTHSWNAWAATHARHGPDPTPAGTTMAGPPRASFHAAVGSGRGRAPVVSPYHPSLRSARFTANDRL